MDLAVATREGSGPQPYPSDLLQQLLPAAVVTAELRGDGDPRLLHAAERSAMRRAAPGRVREFSAGRQCARAAIARLGFADAPIGVGIDRRPQWPASLTGSITHTGGFTAAAAGERRRFRSIGIDAEQIGRVSREIWSRVLLPAEARWLEGLPGCLQAQAATLVFSAKEAFYKCQYPVTGQWLEFTDVITRFCGGTLERGRFSIRAAGRVEWFEPGRPPAIVRFARIGNLAVAAMAIAAR